MTSPICSELTVTDNVPFGQPMFRSAGGYRYYALSLERPAWREWRPGQFVMMRPMGNDGSMHLARPFSICRVTGQSLVLFFQVATPEWECFSRLKGGDKVVLWGPLGTSFEMRPGTPTLLLARGVGIAPFAGYAEQHPDPSSLAMLFGHKHASSNYPTDAMASRLELEDMHDHTPGDLAHFYATMREKMLEYKDRGGICLACGPMDFLHRVWRDAVAIRLPTQISLDQRMACGTGACLGCVTMTSRHWPDPMRAGFPVQTCTSGPVFWASDIDLDAGIQGRRG